jgi:hypothetical protein
MDPFEWTPEVCERLLLELIQDAERGVTESVTLTKAHARAVYNLVVAHRSLEKNLEA